MTADKPTLPELRAALGEISAQVDYIRARWSAAHRGPDVESQVLQSAACHLVIQFQAILEDLPEEFPAQNADLPFSGVRGMRNRLAHGYSDIDSALLWNTIDKDFPAFIAELRRRLR